MKCLSKTLILFLFIIYGSVCVAQDFWEQLNIPAGSSIFSITNDDDGTIYLGKGDGVYSSSNNGVSWEYLGLDKTIYSINHYGNTIYAGNCIYEWESYFWKSDDGGNTWDSIHVNLDILGNFASIVPKGDTILASTWFENDPNILFTGDPDSGWVDIFNDASHEGEYVSDIILMDDNTIFASLYAYLPNKGGVVKSTDFGQTWEFTGLLNHMVSSLAINSSNDVFAGVWSHEQDAWPGVYVLRDGNSTWDTLIVGPYINDIVIMENDDIYCTSNLPTGVIRSEDDGVSFEMINEGLPSGLLDDIVKDNEGYIYVTNNVSLSKSLNPIVTIGTNKRDKRLKLFPNPAINFLTLISCTKTDHIFYDDIKVFDIYGNDIEIPVDLIKPNVIYLDITSIKMGIYIISINCEDYSITEKFIKQ